MKKYFVFIAFSFLAASIFVVCTAWVTIEHPELNVAFEEPSFEDFLELFPKEELPFSVNQEELKNILTGPKKASKATSFDEYTSFLHGIEVPNKFSRMPEYLEPVFAFANDDFHGLVVEKSMGFTNYSNYTLLVYKTDGEYWGTHDFGNISPREVIIPKLDKDFQLELKSLKINWAKNASDKQRTIEDFEEIATVQVDCTLPNPKEVENPFKEIKLFKVKPEMEETKEKVMP